MNKEGIAKRINKKTAPKIIRRIVLLGLVVYFLLLFSDYFMLKNSTVFADGKIYYEGYTPIIAHAYGRLKANPFAVQIFKKLEEEGSNAGKAFALKALKELDNSYFLSLKGKYLINKEPVSCQSGCVGYSIALKDFYARLIKD